MARDDKPSQPTPMMAQYLSLRAGCDGCLLFYRMGDFFELFFEDAATAAPLLGIQLTHRGEHEGAPVPMCGVPVHAADVYLAKLIRAGHRVAIAEQVETPAEAKARAKTGGGKQPLARRVVRVVTPGTLTEEALLDPATANRVVALALVGGEVGIAAADISTGAFELLACAPAELEAELARLGPREVVAPDSLAPHATTRWDEGFDARRGEREMKSRWGVATLEGWGDFSRAELAAAGGLLAYLSAMGGGEAALLEPPRRVQRADHLLIDAASRRSLEITCAANGGRAGSLLAAVDRTRTPAGARQLAADLDAPLTDRAAIEARLALVALFHDDGPLRDRLRRDLSGPDIARALGRLAAGRGAPRDLAALRDGLSNARTLHRGLSTLPEPPTLLRDLLPTLVGQGELEDRLIRALVPEPTDKDFIAAGFDHALDDLRAQGGDARRAIAALETQHREATGVAALKVRHNAVLGYHLEVPQRFADKLLADGRYRHRQTLAGCVRFDAPDLTQAAARVGEAGARAEEIEARHLAELTAAAVAAAPALLATAAALARLDVAAALAERAATSGWCRPVLVDEPCLSIEGGRHPVVEDAVRRAGGRFVANDCRLSREDRVWLVTGPNMGGKSTFLRQNALLAILAQAGSFVPATAATIGIVDRLFSRVGASDDLSRGRSTFMVEMVETAAILTQATPRSLVVLDEVGRGTSTFDGLSIAWAVLEAIHDQVRARCLFATHYHELTQLHGQLPCLSVHHVRARDHRGELVFLHEVAPGAADRSYGLAVARLAGLPPATLARAKAILARLEAERPQGLGDLPLFSTQDPPRNEEVAARSADGGSETAELVQALQALDPDTLTPREALDALYRLKALSDDQP